MDFLKFECLIGMELRIHIELLENLKHRISLNQNNFQSTLVHNELRLLYGIIGSEL
jgi:hypothetical protein